MSKKTLIDDIITSKLTKVEESVMIPLFVLAVLLGFVNVVLRYAFHSAIYGAEEVFTFAFVWAIFIGFSTALKDERHVEVTILYNYLPRSIQKICDFVSSIIGLLFCIFFTYFGYYMVIDQHRFGGVTMDARLPMWIIALILPIGGILLGISFLYRIYKYNIKN
ncbi:MAG: TRAP transporter small permease [Desulfovermiculus sp.]